MLIATLDVDDVADRRDAICGEAGDDKGGTCAEVECIDTGTRKALHTIDDGDVPLHLDVRAHTRELIDILETVLEDGFGDDRGAIGEGQGHGHLRLHVGREARIRERLHIGRMLHRRAHDAYGLIVLIDRVAHLEQLRGDRLQVLRDDVLDQDVTTGCGGGTHEGACLDLVRDDGIGRAMQATDATDADRIGTSALDVGAHRVQEVRDIDDVRLLRHVLDDGSALCEDGSQHDVDGRADGYDVEVDVGGVKSFGGSGLYTAVPDLYLRTEGPEALDVLVDRTGTDRTAARKRNIRHVMLAQQCADKVVGCPDLPDVLIVDRYARHAHGADLRCMTIDTLDDGADLLQCLEHDVDVTHVRQILYNHIFIC